MKSTISLCVLQIVAFWCSAYIDNCIEMPRGVRGKHSAVFPDKIEILGKKLKVFLTVTIFWRVGEK